MDIAVLWVYQQVKDKHGTSLEAGQKPSLCFRARKFMLCVAAGHPVRVLKRPAKDFDACRTVTYQEGLYTIARAVEQLIAVGNRNGITAGASRLLQRAVNAIEDIDENEFTDEEDVTMNVKINEKPAEEVTEGVANTEETGETSAVDPTTIDDKEPANMATSKKTKAKKPRKAKKDKPASVKAAAAPKVKKTKSANGSAKVYTPSPDSKVGKAVAYMKQEVKEAGGVSKLERGFLKDLFERTSKKIGVAVATCSTQYNSQIRSKS